MNGPGSYRQGGAASRIQTFHGTKRSLLGNRAGQVPPAWRSGTMPVQAGVNGYGHVSFGNNRNMRVGPNGGVQKGSGGGGGGGKILLSRLPADVREKEVEDLFTKTIGPLKESFIIYNSQGLSKGMAVITFHRPEHAILAREKYDGKIVDGNRSIKIELVVQDIPSTSTLAARTAPAPQSLLNRIAPPPPINAIPELPKIQIAPLGSKPTPNSNSNPRSMGKRTSIAASSQPTQPYVAIPVSQRRVRQKKGPRRIKKVLAATTSVTTLEQLDKEMEEYRAVAESMMA